MMAPTDTPRWTAGSSLAIAWPGGIALVDSSVGLAGAERIWTRLQRDSKLGTFLKTLAETSEGGFLGLPSFAVVIVDSGRCHVAVRGSLIVEVHLDTRSETLSGEGITTWAEKTLDGVVAIHLGDDVGAETAPLASGVVPASAIGWGEIQAGAAVDTPVDDRSVPLPAPLPVPPADPPAAEADVATPTPAPRDPVPPAGPPQVAAAMAEVSAAEQETLAEDEPEGLPQEPSPSAPNPYASLWDPSIAVDVEAAAIRLDEDQAAPTPSMPDQLSGETVVEEGVVEVVMPRASSGPQVLARFCDRGHANPPERASCFVCGSSVTSEARLTERPQLGWLRVEGGETIPLRGPVIAGRNPESTKVPLTEQPRLVALPHPHVSGTHVVFLIEGWRILAKDLRSSNGTYLRRHGKPPLRLPETAVPLVPGDLIDLGKGLFIHLDRTP